MFEASCLLFLYVETPLHAGSGQGLGAVDLPIQRERVTGYPLVQASGLKGPLRAATRPPRLPDDEWKAIFGPEAGEEASDHAGALSPGDARLLLLPIRSLAGVFAWTTSRDALARFLRDAAAARQSLQIERGGQKVLLDLPVEPQGDNALVSDKKAVTAGDKLVLEEFSFAPNQDQTVKDIATWLAANAFPPADEYDYWRTKLLSSLVVLPENAFRDFSLYATEVVTRVRLIDEKKTVARGALWTEESLPTDTLLYAPLHATRARRYDKAGNKYSTVPADWYDTGGAARILTRLGGLDLAQLQLGGDETVGRGMVRLRFGEVHNA